MNQRIRELAKQAGAQAISKFDFVDLEKFAELIVRECIDIAYREGDKVDYLALHFGATE